ncbi:MAG: cell division protein ZapA [Burkholderiaceae bacterium]
MKQLEVQIMGQSYLLGCPEGGEARLLSAVDKVDAAMCRIRDAGKIKARDRIAVLTALNLAFDLGETPADAMPNAPEVVPLASDVADARLAQVLRRLEQALGNDGRLI